MAYGSIKADNLIHDDGEGTDVTVSISSIASKASTTGAVFTGNIDLDNQQQLRLREADAGGDNFVALRAPAALASDITLTFPDTQPAVVAADQAAPNTAGTGVLQSNTNGELTWASLGLDVAATWTRPQRGEITSVSHSSATIDINFNESNNFHIQLVSGTADVTSITASNAQPGQSGSIFIQQPASGTAVTFSGWDTEYKFPARTPLAGITATLGGVDRVDYVVKDADEIHCVSTLDMAS